jgi:multidrug efflux pump subunit AcrA (membrane-fusion protein)
MRVGGTFVAAVESDQRVALKPVRLGRDYGGRVAVLEGVQGNERLIINPTADLSNGAPVRVETSPRESTPKFANRD